MRTCRIVHFVIPADNRAKIKTKTSTSIRTLAKNEKVMQLEGDGDTSCNRCTWNGLKSLVRRLEEMEIGG